MKSSSKRRWLIALTCGVLVICAVPFGIRYWYFREVEHHRSTSPDGQWTVVVTKRMEDFPEPVDVRVKIQNNEDRREWLSEKLDSPDVWSDVKPDSYRVEWVSPNEFVVGGRDPNDGFETRWKFDGQKWIGRPYGWD
jgi:hypothetical protein